MPSNSLAIPHRKLLNSMRVCDRYCLTRSNGEACTASEPLPQEIGTCDDIGHAVDDRKTHREVLAPPLTWVWVRGISHGSRHAIGDRRSLSTPPVPCRRHPS